MATNKADRLWAQSSPVTLKVAATEGIGTVLGVETYVAEFNVGDEVIHARTSNGRTLSTELRGVAWRHVPMTCRHEHS